MADYPMGNEGTAYFSVYALDDNADTLTAGALRLVSFNGAAPQSAAEAAPAWLTYRTVSTETVTTGALVKGRLHLEITADLAAAGPEAFGTYIAEIDVTDKSGAHALSFGFEIDYTGLLLDEFSGAAGAFTGHSPDVYPTGSAWLGDTGAYELHGAGALAPQAAHVGPSRVFIDSGATDHTAVCEAAFSAQSGLVSLLARLIDDGAGTITALQVQIDPATETLQLQELTDDGTTTTAPSLGSADFLYDADVSAGTPVEVALECLGTSIEVRLDGDPVLTASSAHSAPGTHAGLQSVGDAHLFPRFAAEAAA